MTSLSDIERKALARFSYGEHVRPMRDWLTLLTACLVLFLASAAWNGWLYYEIAYGEEANGAASSPSLDTSAVNRAEAVFTARAEEQTRYEHTYQFVDPSK